MSDQPNETPEVETPEAAPVTPVDLSKHEEGSIVKLWSRVKGIEPRLNEIYTKIKNSAPPTQAEIDKELAESEDEKLIKLRTQIEKAKAAIAKAEAEAKTLIIASVETLSEDDVKKLRDDFSTTSNEMRSVVNLIASLADTLGHDDVKAALAEYKIPSLRGVSVGGSSSARTSDGTSRPTPRIESILVKKDGKELRNFTGDKGRLAYAATYMKFKTDELRDAWLVAATGSADSDWRDAKESVTFTHGDYEITVVPQEK